MNPPVTLVLGTGNSGKVAEFRVLLAGGDWRLVSLSDFADLPDLEEDVSSFADNARAKAVQLAGHLHQWVLADDTGLEVDALDGAPGVLSARYAGPGATAEVNRQRLLAELGDLPLERRSARFVCHLALADPAGRIRAIADGCLYGRIRLAPSGNRGFGYDSLFEITEYHRTLAELGETATACLSHRARAVRAIRSELVSMLA